MNVALPLQVQISYMTLMCTDCITHASFFQTKYKIRIVREDEEEGDEESSKPSSASGSGSTGVLVGK